MTVKVEVEEGKEGIVGIEDSDHMIDQAHMIDQERRGTIQALDIPQVCFVIIAK